MDERAEFRQQIGRALEARMASLTNDAVGLSAHRRLLTGEDRSLRLANLVARLYIAAIQDGAIDPRSQPVAELRRVARDTRLPIRDVFDLVYIIERAALEELALHESFGVTSEPWPVITQLVRRSSFELLAGLAERPTQDSGEDALIDPLTTLHTRAVLLAALEKEIRRSERFGHPFALILFDVDRLSDINDKHGYGVGDRVLERIGIVIRKYFREQDWVSRSSGDTFGVLLPETPRGHAEQLAERVRETVQERMSLRDHRSDEQVLVTVSVALVIVEAVDGGVGADRVMKDAEEAVHRAKHAGRNRVERMEISVKAPALPPRDSQPL